MTEEASRPARPLRKVAQGSDGLVIREPTRARRRTALAVAILLPLILFVTVAAAVDRPVWGPGRGGRRSDRAALAIRDTVHPVEKFGTWLFVEPYLKEAYAEVFTFTQTPKPGVSNYVTKQTDQKAEFQESLVSALSRYERVDLYLLAHTNAYVIWVEEIDPALRQNLGLVYNSGCTGGRQSERWMALEVGAYVAHPEIASHASFFVFFLRRWNAGRRLDEAVAQANTRSDLLFDRLQALGLAPKAAKAWGKSRAQIWGSPTLTVGGPRP